MFTHQQITHFRSFGFVVLRGLFDADEVRRLTREVRSSLVEAFGGLGTDDDAEGTGGIRGDYLPLAQDRTPFSQALVADDPRLFQGSTELLGGPTVPTIPIATCFTSNAGWHVDDGRGVGGLKFLAYLEPRTATTGALRVIPGSDEPGFARRLDAYWDQDPAGQGFDPWPLSSVVLETQPGDVIAFPGRLFHASEGGDRRMAWSIEYLPWPGLGDRACMAAVRDAVVEAVDYDRYDRERWPTWREWVAGASPVSSREVAMQRLRLLDVLGDGDPG